MFDLIALDFVVTEHDRRVARIEAVAWQLGAHTAPHSVRLGVARALVALATRLAPTAGDELLGGHAMLKAARS
ncbi:MAG: hypothetical protein ACTHNK_01320 [Thermomicrobiales bacterium]